MRESNRLCGSRSARPVASGSCLGLSGVPPLLPRLLCYSARRSQTSSRAARPAASGSCLGLLGVPPFLPRLLQLFCSQVPDQFSLCSPCRLRLLSGTFGRSAHKNTASPLRADKSALNVLAVFLRAELFILDFYLKYSTPDSNTFRSCSPQILMATDWPWRSM